MPTIDQEDIKAAGVDAAQILWKLRIRWRHDDYKASGRPSQGLAVFEDRAWHDRDQKS